jgi:sugar phosphate isomerase/epimerase
MLPTLDLKAQSPIPIAVQLFSLRTQCEQDLDGTLAYVRSIGFEGVELAGAYGRTGEQWSKLLAKHSLKCCGSHTPLPQLTGDNLKGAIEFNRTLHNARIILPGLPHEYQVSTASWRSAADTLNRLAEQLQPHGMRVGYHNHAIEFKPMNGVSPWELLYTQTASDVILQLDTGNARIGGADPIALIERYPQRAETVHVKDYTPEAIDPVLGASKFDWERFAKTCTAHGSTEWYIIEHDSPSQKDVKLCLNHFRQLAKLGNRE